MGDLRPEILAVHEAQQANFTMQLARQSRNQERQARRKMGRAGTPATPVPAWMPAFSLASSAAAGSHPAVQQITAPPMQYDI
eukprot:9228924-Pyramimonas_sp.AAC.1